MTCDVLLWCSSALFCLAPACLFCFDHGAACCVSMIHTGYVDSRELCELFSFLPSAYLFPSHLHLFVCCSLLFFGAICLCLISTLSVLFSFPLLRLCFAFLSVFSDHLGLLVASCYFYVISLSFIYSPLFSSFC